MSAPANHPQRRPHRPLAAAGIVLAAAGLAWFWTPPERASGQVNELNDKLRELNVRHVTPHYVLAGTVSDARLKEYGQTLEYIYKEYAVGFSELVKKREKSAPASRPSGKPSSTAKPRKSADAGGASGAAQGKTSIVDEDEAGRFPVIVFATAADYQKFGREHLQGATEHTSGAFVPGARLLLILDDPKGERPFDTLFHEAFHQFVHRYIKKPPMWLNEGLATHYGFAKPTRNGLDFRNPPDDYWVIVRKAMSAKQAIPIWEVMTADRAEFYDATPVDLPGFGAVRRANLYYGEAYTFCHMLLSDAEGRKRLRAFIKDLAESDGRKTLEITRKYFDQATIERLTPHWIKYVNGRPETR